MSWVPRTRLWWMVPTFFAMTALTFGAAHLAPGDPLQLSEEVFVEPSAVNAARRELELDRPIFRRYLLWLGRLVRFDLGTSAVDRRPVVDKIGEALPRTLLVSGLALLLAVFAATVLGTLLAWRRGWLARTLAAALGLGSAVPSFWVALLLLFFLATPRGVELFPLYGLKSSPDGGLVDLLWHLVLPVACLAIPSTTMFARFVREGVRAELGKDYIRAGRARGLGNARLLLRHALPNALLPVVTVIGFHVPHVFAGSVVIERVFGISGMGLLAFEAIGLRDYPVVLGVSVVMSVVTLVSMFVTDVSLSSLDPRVRLPEAGT